MSTKNSASVESVEISDADLADVTGGEGCDNHGTKWDQGSVVKVDGQWALCQANGLWTPTAPPTTL